MNKILILVGMFCLPILANAARPDSTIYPTATNSGGGWWYVPYLGDVNASSSDDNWMYHDVLGWIYVQDGGSINGAWYYDQYADDWFYGYKSAIYFYVDYNGAGTYRLLGSVQYGAVVYTRVSVNVGSGWEPIYKVTTTYYDHDFVQVHQTITYE